MSSADTAGIQMPAVDRPSDRGRDDSTMAPEAGWTAIANVDDVPFNRGVAALVESVEGIATPVAVFRLGGGDINLVDGVAGRWYCVDHVDPATLVPVMARGLVGSVSPPVSDTNTAIDIVVSPIYKHRYDLATGRCLNDDTLRLTTHEVAIVERKVWVRPS